MKRILVTTLAAVMVVGILAGAGFGAAASTGDLNGGAIYAGITDYFSDGDGVTISYSTDVSGTGDFFVNSLTIDGIDAPDGYLY